jgi:hypothetical protein
MELNVTDSYGLSTYETFTITVGTPAQYVPLALEALLAVMLILLISMFALLIRSREKESAPKQQDPTLEQSADQVTQIKGALTCASR